MLGGTIYEKRLFLSPLIIGGLHRYLNKKLHLSAVYFIVYLIDEKAGFLFLHRTSIENMILHVDMDAFFASVEQLDHPQLKGKPVIVGGCGRRGVVAAASYEARAFGVSSAMPMFQARRKCPQAIVVAARRPRYSEISKQIMTILSQYTPLIEQVSIDEAFLDMTGCERLFGHPVTAAKSIKALIREVVHLTCSIGVAPNKFLAKIASDMKKPDGLYTISSEEVLSFTASLPLSKVPGVGKQTLDILKHLGIQRLGDIRSFPITVLEKRLGKNAHKLKALSAGIDNSPVATHRLPKSVSSEETLEKDSCHEDVLKKFLLKHSEAVAYQLRQLNVGAQTITLKIKHTDFSQVTRRKKVSTPIRSADAVYHQAVALLEAFSLRQTVRLIGVGASGLIPSETPVQASLFENKRTSNWEKIDQTLDDISQKFGRTLVKRAVLAQSRQQEK